MQQLVGPTGHLTVACVYQFAESRLQEKERENIDKTNKHTVVLGHMLPHKYKQKFYKWAWQGGTEKTKT